MVISLTTISCAKKIQGFDIQDAAIKREVGELMAPSASNFGRTVKIQNREIIQEYENLLSDLSLGKGQFAKKKVQQLADLYMGIDIYNKHALLRNYTEERIVKTKGARFEKAIALYNSILESYPDDPDNWEILYQMAHAYDMINDKINLKIIMEKLISAYPDSMPSTEVRFRLAELYFEDGQIRLAKDFYQHVIDSYKENDNDGSNAGSNAKDKAGEYYNYARYKLAWSAFNLKEYKNAIKNFIYILDKKLLYTEDGLSSVRNPASYAGAESIFVNDLIKGVALSLVYLDEIDNMNIFFAGNRELYADTIYKKVAEIYEADQKIDKVLNTYNAYTVSFGLNLKAPFFKSMEISLYMKNNLVGLANDERKNYVNSFGPDSEWFNANPLHRKNILRIVKKTVEELGKYYHSRAQKTADDALYRQAFEWYEKYLDLFGDDRTAAEVSFLYAEALYESGRFEDASIQYGITAYEYKAPDRADDAAYAAVYSLEKGLQLSFKEEEKEIFRLKLVKEAERFINSHQTHKMLKDVVTRIVEMLYNDKKYNRLREFGNLFLNQFLAQFKDNQQAVPLVSQVKKYMADSYFIEENFEKSFNLYLELAGPEYIIDTQAVKELAASSLYKLTVAIRDGGNEQLAANRFFYLQNLLPSTRLAPVALFDNFSYGLKQNNLVATFTALKILMSDYQDYEYLDSKMPEMILLYARKLFNQSDYAGMRSFSIGIRQLFAYIDSTYGTYWMDEAIFHDMDSMEADSYFKEKRYMDAFDSYKQLLEGLPEYDNKRAGIKKIMASSLYKEGMLNYEKHRLQKAASLMMMIRQELPELDIADAALYKSGEIYLELKDYDKVEQVYQMLSGVDNATYGLDLLVKLAGSMEQAGWLVESAKQYSLVAQTTPDYMQAKNALYRAASLFEKHGDFDKAFAIFNNLLDQYSIEPDARLSLSYKTANMAETLGKEEEALELYQGIIEDYNAPQGNNQKLMVSEAYLKLAGDEYTTFESIRLEAPLEKQLNDKKASLKILLRLYSKSAGYNVAQTATLSTFKAAASIEQFINALVNSPPPKGLTKNQKKFYGKLIRKKVRPYRIRAIKTYRSNIRRAQRFGRYDVWIKKSYAALARLFPLRYDKQERAELFSEKIQFKRAEK